MSGTLPKVGVIGMGRMGSAMAATLARAGFALTVWNRDPAKSAAVAEATGAAVAASPAAAAGEVDVLITSLADDLAVRSVYLAADGVADGIAAPTVALETSTIDPETVRDVGDAVDAAGAGFLDCPVSGSVTTVEAGALTIMAGGDPALVDQVRPVLDALAANVVHVGPRGAGAATKLSVNGLVHAINVALSEAVVLAEKAGVDRASAYEVFAGGAGGAPFVHYKRAAFLDPDAAQVAFSLDLVAKDLQLITALGRRVGAPLRQAETSLAVVNDAIAAGFGGRDMSTVAVHLRERG